MGLMLFKKQLLVGFISSCSWASCCSSSCSWASLAIANGPSKMQGHSGSMHGADKGATVRNRCRGKSCHTMHRLVVDRLMLDADAP
eukprot:scaffold136893_cov17-Tisochrysis_lutea.AAC.4